jgi:hypothetical protein
MSIAALTWAWSQQGLPPSSKLVLLALADHADAQGHCWPSIERIKTMTGLSQATIYRVMQVLTGLGMVQQLPRGRGYAFNLTLDTIHDECNADNNSIHPECNPTQVIIQEWDDTIHHENDTIHGEKNTIQDECLTVMNHNEPPKKESADAKRALPTDWQPDDGLLAWAKERAPHVDTTIEREKFIDFFCHIKPARRSAEGWRASWRSWLLRARRDYTPAAVRFPTRSERTSQRNAAIVGDALADRPQAHDAVRNIPGTPFRLIDRSKA